MLEDLAHHFAGRSPLAVARDAFDVFLVYYIVYRALLVLRGTRAMQVGVGMGMVFVLYVIARVFQLMTLLSIMRAVVSSILLIIVVVFQNDIRRFLHRVGSRAWFSGLARANESRVIDQVVEAATELARHRTGAIITFEQEANLDEFVGVHKGHDIDAAVTKELLVSLFIPEAMNKLHDGAVVIRSLRIAKAGVFFPMPEGRVVDESFGSRHRAALGITEETDAVVVVVSEERGSISFCFNGNIASNLDGPKLRSMLEAIFSPKTPRKRRRPDLARPSHGTPIAVERAAREPEDTVGRTTGEMETLRFRRGADQEPPSALRSRTTGASPSEPPPPLRPRLAGDAAESIHSTGRHTSDLDAARHLRGAEGDPVSPCSPRSASAGDSEPPPPLRPRARGEGGDAAHITGRHSRIKPGSPAARTPLATGAPESRDMPRGSAAVTPVGTSSEGDDGEPESERQSNEP